jgi:hypothetical protein
MTADRLPWAQRPLRLFLTIATAAALIFTLSLAAIHRWLFALDNAQTFADAAGGIGTLFAALAFAGLVTALVMQRQELQLQRRELRMQRKELKETRAEFKQQNRTMDRDLFERGFFQLLAMQRRAADELHAVFPGDLEPRRGQAALREAADRVAKIMRWMSDDELPDSGAVALKRFLYEECLVPAADFSSYFDATQALLWMADRARLTDADFVYYMTIFRSMTTEAEQCTLLAFAVSMVTKVDGKTTFGGIVRSGFFEQSYMRPGVGDRVHLLCKNVQW